MEFVSAFQNENEKFVIYRKFYPLLSNNYFEPFGA